jgi:predicted RNase H-like HicB family nuclease
MQQVIVYPDFEDGGWVAEAPTLPGCVSQGATKEEVLRNVRQAITQWIEAARFLSREVPPEQFDVQVCVV